MKITVSRGVFSRASARQNLCCWYREFWQRSLCWTRLWYLCAGWDTYYIMNILWMKQKLEWTKMKKHTHNKDLNFDLSLLVDLFIWNIIKLALDKDFVHRDIVFFPWTLNQKICFPVSTENLLYVISMSYRKPMADGRKSCAVKDFSPCPLTH